MTDAGPPRVVGKLGATALVVGSMLGVGILLTPPLVAQAVDSTGAFFALWIAGGVVSLCGAACYAELGTLLPRGGGDVVFQRAAFGRSLAAASGVVVFAVSFAASIAAMAAALGTYQVQMLLTAAGFRGDLSAQLGALPITGAAVVGLCVVAATTAINLLGARLAAGLQTLLCLVPVITLGGLACASLLGAPVQLPELPPPRRDATVLSAFLGVYFSYAGWPTVVYIAGEVRRPGRVLGTATVGGTALVTALYLLVGGGLISAFGLDGLAALGESGTALARALLGPGADTAMAALIGVAILASINGTVLAGARIAAALAEEGVLPHVLARRSGRGQAPRNALLAQAMLAGLYICSGTFTTILATSGVAMMLVGALTITAALRLRATRRTATRPFRVPALPLVAGTYILTGTVVVFGTLAEAAASGSLGVPLAGVAVLVLTWAASATANRRSD
ncbi:MAG: amino acid permease [Myxococcota bacterium]|nr:amino acid permease [Myxococcota bacterium]MEC8422832.1 amino acid permease [Myxococcota bacterium]